MESEKQDSNRIEKYLLWGLPFLLVFIVALFLLFSYLLPQGWTTYTGFTVAGAEKGIAFDSSGNAWIGTFTGLVNINGEEWTTYSEDNSGLSMNEIGSVSIDSSDNVWVGTAHGLDVFDGERWMTYSHPFQNVVCTAIDSAENVWIGDQFSGVTVFDGEGWHRYTQSNSGLANWWIYNFAFDPSGNLWIGTGDGVSVFDGEHWTAYTKSNSGLIDDGVSSIAIDSAGNAWIGTYNGVSVFDGLHWTTYTEHNSGLISDSVSSIAVDSSGSAWIGTSYGVSFFDGQLWTTFTRFNSGLGGNRIGMITLDPSERVWFRSDGGISIFDPDQASSISSWLLRLREYFFSPASIGITILSLVVLWFTIKEDNKLALVGLAGWVLSLLFFGFQIIDDAWVSISIASNILAVGALLGGRNKKDAERRKRGILKGILIAFVIDIILGAIRYIWIILVMNLTG
jgi:hypothetical protein